MLAFIGLSAISTFGKEIQNNVSLSMVVGRAKPKNKEQARQLRLLGLSMQASETSVAILDGNDKKVGATLDVPYKGGGDDLSFPLDIEFQSEKEAAAKSCKFEVLLVDDALINRKVFERMLKKVDRVKTIVTADSAKTALELLEQNTFDVVSSFWQRI